MPSDNELLKSIEIVGKIRGAKILNINTGIFMTSLDLYFCLYELDYQFRHYQRGSRKVSFPQVLLGNSLERYFNGEYCDQDWKHRVQNSYKILQE